MARYAVSLFLRDQESTTVGQLTNKERLQTAIIEASSHAEAFGSYVRQENREFRQYPIVYHNVLEIPAETTQHKETDDGR